LGSITHSTKAIEAIEELIKRRKWVIDKLKELEAKYGIDSRKFYEKWVKGEIPELDDPEVHGDFMVWAGLVEELERLDKALLNKVKG